MFKGVLVTIEGTEGAGKGTVIRWSKEYLAPFNVPLVWTREPGGTTLGEAIRKLFLRNDLAISSLAELLLCFAGRAQHLEQVIKPALEDGKLVICDRFTDSSYVYQGYARGVELSKVEQLEELVQQQLRPDFTLLLDVPVNVSLGRLKARTRKLDRIECERYEFFESVTRGYREMAKRDSERYYVVDANCGRSELFKRVETFWASVLERLKTR